MKVITSLLNNYIDEQTAVTVGKFDGIHKGHELLTKKLLEQKAQGLAPCVVTFDISPRIRLGKDKTKLLITNEERLHLLDRAGIDYLAQCPFEQEIMHLEPETFIELLVEHFHMKYLVCGTDFCFGRKGRGNVTLLRELAQTYGFTLEVLEKLQQDHRDISSTFVREEIAQGNVRKGNELLGYRYFVWGRVVHGKHLGTRIGIPTINLIPPEDKLLPRYGVYVTEIEIDHHRYHGVTNVGVKPTVTGEQRVGIETHILDFDQDVYEKQVRVAFLEHIRDEQKFDSVDALRAQMQKDKQFALQFFNRQEPLSLQK